MKCIATCPSYISAVVEVSRLLNAGSTLPECYFDLVEAGNDVTNVVIECGPSYDLRRKWLDDDKCLWEIWADE